MKKIHVFIICLLVSRIVWAQAGIPRLNSWTPPGDAKDIAVIYLDFDGHFVDFYSVWTDYWGGGAMHAEACHFTPQQVRETWQIVAEDYAPFQVNVTTDSMVYQNARYDKRVRVVLTNTDHWRPGDGGVAFYNSITFGDDTPVWVFPRRLGTAKAAGDCASHEAGHALDLIHHGIYDDKCNWLNSYNPGGGEGEVTWAPIMGASYNVNLGTWDNQERDTAKCSGVYRDDIERITRYFPFKTDDHPDQQGEGVENLIQSATADIATIHTTGLITHRNDIDVFSFTATQKSRLVLRVKGVWANHAPLQANNLDVKIELWKDGGPHQRYAPPSSVEVGIDSVVDAGKYFIAVSGDGNNMMSDYGSLGNYEIRGELRQKLVQVDLGKDTAICVSMPYVLDAGNPGARYLWSTGATTRTIPVSASNTYAVTVSIDDYHVSDTIRVDVVESVLVDFDVRPNKPTCSYQQVSFEDKSVAICPAKKIVSRSWILGSEERGDTARVSRSFLQGSYAITLRITDSDNNIYSRTRQIEINPLFPPQQFAGPDIVELCAGSSHTFDLSHMNERTENYNWSTGQTGPVITVTEPGEYYVSVYQAATECLARDTVEVRRPDFVLDFDYRSTLMTSYFNARVSTPCADDMPSTWLWDFGDGKTSSAPYPSHRYTRPGDYPVTLTVVSAGTTRTIRRVISTQVNFRNITRPLPFQPDSSLWQILSNRKTFNGLVIHHTVVSEQLVLDMPGDCDYQLMTVTGQTLGRGRLIRGTNTIPTSGIQRGVFFLLLLDKEKRELIRLFKR